MVSEVSAKEYRSIDVAAVQRILEPLESDLRASAQLINENASHREKEEFLIQAMEDMIFDTLDRFPAFSEIVDYLEDKCNKLGVSLYSKH